VGNGRVIHVEKSRKHTKTNSREDRSMIQLEPSTLINLVTKMNQKSTWADSPSKSPTNCLHDSEF
jgi:hypothetical protein